MNQFDPPDDLLDQRAQQFFRALEDDTEALVDPLAPAQVRRLGERRRHRRHATVAASTLGLGVVAAASAVALHGGLGQGPAHPDIASRPTASAPTSHPSIPVFQPSTPPTSTPSPSGSPLVTTTPTASPTPRQEVTGTPTPAPTPSQDPPPAAMGWDDVAGSAQVLRSGSPMKQTRQLTETASPQYAVSVCERDRTSLGQTTLYHRTFEGDGVVAEVLAYDFANTADASAAKATLREWYAGCKDQLAANSYTGVEVGSPVTTAVGSNAKQFPPTQSTFRLVRGVDANGTSFFEEASIFQVGSRVEWLVYTLSGAQDDNHDTQPGGPVGSVYPGIENAAAITNRLAPGA